MDLLSSDCKQKVFGAMPEQERLVSKPTCLSMPEQEQLCQITIIQSHSRARTSE